MIDSVQPSKLVLNLSDKLKPIPKPEDLVFGQVCRCHLILEESEENEIGCVLYLLGCSGYVGDDRPHAHHAF